MIRTALLRQDEVADILGVSTRTVRDLASAGELPRVVLGRRATRYRLTDVEALIDARTVSPNDSDPEPNPGRVEESAGQGRHVPA